MSDLIPLEPMADLSMKVREWSLGALRNPVQADSQVKDPYGVVETVVRLIEDLRSLRETSDSIAIDVKISNDGETDDAFSGRVGHVDELLELVRDCRRTIGGQLTRRLVRELFSVDRSLHSEFEREIKATLPYLDEHEKFLIALGAGDDSDAELVMGLIPAAEDLSFIA